MKTTLEDVRAAAEKLMIWPDYDGGYDQKDTVWVKCLWGHACRMAGAPDEIDDGPSRQWQAQSPLHRIVSEVMRLTTEPTSPEEMLMLLDNPPQTLDIARAMRSHVNLTDAVRSLI